MTKRTESWLGSHAFRRCVLAAAICAAALASPSAAFSQPAPPPPDSAAPVDRLISGRPVLDARVPDEVRVLEKP